MSNETPQQASRTSAFTYALHEGLERMKTIIDNDSFTFVINKERFETDIFEAVLLSPAVHERLTIDRSDRMFVIEDENIPCKMISILIGLVSGETVELSLEERKSLIFLCRYLKNKKFEKIIFGMLIGMSSSVLMQFYEQEPKYDAMIASQFYSYSQEDICLFDVDVLEALLSSKSLVVWHEDSLLDTILELGCDYYSLLRYVRFEFLTLFGISRFVDTIDFSCIMEDIWSRLIIRLKGVDGKDIFVRRYQNRGFCSAIIEGIPDIFF
jgi:hypothetical protein